MSNVKVAINAEILSGGGSGGIEQVIIGLVSALGKLEDGDEEYTLVTHHRDPNWLKPYTGSGMQIVTRPWNRNDRKRAVVTAFKKAIGPIVKTLAKPWVDQISARTMPKVAQSNGYWESLGVDVIHFPTQGYVISQIPSIYNPHDLQHLHLPEFFTTSQIRYRETLYRAGCQYAKAVAVHSNWVKDDIIRHYGTEPEKIFTIPWGAGTQAYSPISEETLSVVCKNFNLPHIFALYPAQTWPHKNHLRLLKAVALLREQRNVVVNLVCTGIKSDFWPKIHQFISELKLENQVQFLGFVEPEEMCALYRAAQFVIIPTLFEAGSMPMLDGWREGTPVACSTVTSLPEQAGDAALLFNPISVEEIAEAIYRLATDSELREKLRQRGTERIQLFSWERTARMYRALYRRIGDHVLTEEDKALLGEAMDTRLSLEKENR